MRNLSKLLVENNELEGTLNSSLFISNVSVLEYVNLSWNQFDGEIPYVLWSLSHLRVLDISGNNFTGVVLNVNYFSATGASYNLSNNLFYRNVTFDVRSFESIDLSRNYFQGLALDISGFRVMDICFTGLLNQRSLDDCSKFYGDRGLVFVDGRVQRPSKNGHKRFAPPPHDFTVLAGDSYKRSHRQLKYISLDIHLGQSYSVLVTANQPPKDYYVVVSSGAGG